MNASARELLAARARRVARIRRSVVAAALATFALAWGVIAHDGSMGTTTTASVSATTSSSSTSTSSAAAGTTREDTDAVTTAQS